MAEKTELEEQLEDMRGKVGVSRLPADWEEQWHNAIGMTPKELYAIWAKDLPEDTSIFIELNGVGQAEYRMWSSTFELEGYLSRNHGSMSIKEVRVKEGQQRQGTGKTILRNHIDLGDKWGMTDIKLRGGREDGPFFWSRRAAVLEDEPRLKELFATQVVENAAKLDLSDETKKKLAEILEKGSARMNFEIASLGQVIDGTPIGVPLLRATNPRVEFHLKDQDQMAIVKQKLI